MNRGKLTYSNLYYDVYKIAEEDVVVVKGEPMNWAVVNREFNTVEATIGPYPYAVGVADSLADSMASIRADTKPTATISSIN